MSDNANACHLYLYLNKKRIDNVFAMSKGVVSSRHIIPKNNILNRRKDENLKNIISLHYQQHI